MTDTPSSRCDDANVMRLWRECGLPEYFLGNGGSNHGLVALEERIRAEERERCARIAETAALAERRFIASAIRFENKRESEERTTAHE